MGILGLRWRVFEREKGWNRVGGDKTTFYTEMFIFIPEREGMLTAASRAHEASSFKFSLQ